MDPCPPKPKIRMVKLRFADISAPGWMTIFPAGTEGRTEARQAAEARKKLFLRLERKQMDRASALLALGAGEIPVYMHLPEEKITLLCPRDHWSDGSESSLRRLREELGEANVVLKE